MIATFLFILKREKRWIKYGKSIRNKHLTFNGNKYYLEEAGFQDYKESLHYYFRIVADIAASAEVREVKYDYYDWSTTVFRFENTTIKILRCIDKVHLIKSDKPVSIEELEGDNPHF